MIDTLPNFVEALRAAAVLEPEQLAKVERDLRARHADFRGLAKDLLARGWLTTYQIQHLLHGKGDRLVLEPYVVLDRLGEGGMGQVFRARHRKLGRVVALKVIRRDEVKDAKVIHRFRREIVGLAKMSHPNVVSAIDADQIGDTYYYVMEYVEGLDLTRLVSERGPLPVHTACEYMRQAAVALQHAHEHGLVHRDVKPSNLLVTADGLTVKLLDLGLARMREPGPEGHALGTVTQIGIFIGTPDFVAPEQAVNSRDVDIRADLYSLGCTFYYLLTGAPPFPGESTMEKLIKHKLEEPIPVDKIRSDVPRAVVALLRKLMAKQPDERYQTPAEVAAALVPLCTAEACQPSRSPAPLERPRSPKVRRAPLAPTVALSAGEAVEATAVLTPPPAPAPSRPSSVRSFTGLRRPVGRSDWWKWGLVGGITAALFGVMLLVLANLVSNPSTAQPPPDEKPPPAPVKTGPEPKRTAAPANCLDQLDGARLPEDAVQAWQALGQSPPAELVGVLGAHAWRHWGPVRAVAVDPDEKVIATAGDDGVICIWELDTGKLLMVLREHTGTVWSVAFSPRGEYLASAGEDGTVKVWQTGSWELKHMLEGHRGSVHAVLFPPQHAAMVASGGADGVVRAWSLRDGQSVAVLDPQAGPIWCLAFSAKGEHLAAGAESGVIKVWEIQSRKELESLEIRGKARVTAVAFGRDENEVLSADAAGKISLWTRARRTARELPSHQGAVTCLAAMPGLKRLFLHFVSGGADGEVHLLRPDKKPDALLPGFEVKALKGHTQAVSAVAVARSGRTIVSGGLDGTVRVWDGESGGERFPQPGHHAAVRAIAFGPEGKSLYSASSDRSARLWDLAGRREFEFRGHTEAVTSLALSTDGKQFFTASEDRSIKLWDAIGGRDRKTLTGHDQRVLSLAATPDGKLLATGDAGGIVLLWDGATGAQVARLKQHGDRVLALAFTPDGKLLASASWDGRIVLWDAGTQQARGTLSTSSYEVLALAFSPDGKTLLSAGGDKTVHLWDAAGGQPFRNFEADARVLAAAWFPDGRRFACACEDGQVLVFDAGQPERLHQIRLPGPAFGLAVAADGRHLATANANGSVYILRLPARSGRS